VEQTITLLHWFRPLHVTEGWVPHEGTSLLGASFIQGFQVGGLVIPIPAANQGVGKQQDRANMRSF
jgi:hypothetical protein